MKKFTNSLPTLILGLSISACSSEITWDGIYEYEADYGDTISSTQMIVYYTLTIQTPQCSLEASGYQTYRKILCEVKATEDTAKVFFKEYTEDSNVPPRLEMKAGTHLFSLKKQGDALTTHWDNLNPEATPESNGRYFRRAISQ